MRYGEAPEGEERPDAAREYAGGVHHLRSTVGFAELHRALVQAIERPFGLLEQTRYPRLSVGRFKTVRLLLRDEGDFDGDPLLDGIAPEWTAAVRAHRRGGELVALFDSDSQPGTVVRVAYLVAGDAVRNPDLRGLSLARELCARTRAILAKSGVEDLGSAG